MNQKESELQLKNPHESRNLSLKPRIDNQLRAEVLSRGCAAKQLEVPLRSERITGYVQPCTAISLRCAPTVVTRWNFSRASFSQHGCFWLCRCTVSASKTPHFVRIDSDLKLPLLFQGLCCECLHLRLRLYSLQSKRKRESWLLVSLVGVACKIETYWSFSSSQIWSSMTF